MGNTDSGDDQNDVQVLTSETVNRVVRQWETVGKDIERLEIEKEKALKFRRDLANDLGKMLVPDQAKSGETFHIWIRRDTKRECLLRILVDDTKNEAGQHIRRYQVAWYV